MSIPTARAPITSESQRTTPSPAASATSAANFSSRMRCREIAADRSRSSVPRSSSPAMAFEPAPIAATINSKGTTSENSSIPR
jgi:hypothetical protein